jgi:hypothetical protein
MKRPVFQMTVVVKIKTNILCSVTFFDNLSVYAITWENIIEPGLPQMIIWRMRITHWTPKATNKHSEYVKQRFSTATTIAQTHLNVTLYVHCLSSSFRIW